MTDANTREIDRLVEQAMHSSDLAVDDAVRAIVTRALVDHVADVDALDDAVTTARSAYAATRADIERNVRERIAPFVTGEADPRDLPAYVKASRTTRPRERGQV
jgi:hypothetical protein